MNSFYLLVYTDYFYNRDTRQNGENSRLLKGDEEINNETVDNMGGYLSLTQMISQCCV